MTFSVSRIRDFYTKSHNSNHQKPSLSKKALASIGFLLATQTFTVPCNSIWPPPGKPIIPGQHSADAVRQGGAVRAGPRVGGQPQVRLI